MHLKLQLLIQEVERGIFSRTPEDVVAPQLQNMGNAAAFAIVIQFAIWAELSTIITYGIAIAFASCY